MKIYLTAIMMMFLVGCSESSNNTNHYQMPPELEGCKVFTLKGDLFYKTLYVVKCPGVTVTNWHEGGKNKNTYSVTTQDGK